MALGDILTNVVSQQSAEEFDFLGAMQKGAQIGKLKADTDRQKAEMELQKDKLAAGRFDLSFNILNRVARSSLQIAPGVAKAALQTNESAGLGLNPDLINALSRDTDIRKNFLAGSTQLGRPKTRQEQEAMLLKMGDLYDANELFSVVKEDAKMQADVAAQQATLEANRLRTEQKRQDDLQKMFQTQYNKAQDKVIKIMQAPKAKDRKVALDGALTAAKQIRKDFQKKYIESGGDLSQTDLRIVANSMIRGIAKAFNSGALTDADVNSIAQLGGFKGITDQFNEDYITGDVSIAKLNQIAMVLANSARAHNKDMASRERSAREAISLPASVRYTDQMRAELLEGSGVAGQTNLYYGSNDLDLLNSGSFFYLDDRGTPIGEGIVEINGVPMEELQNSFGTKNTKATMQVYNQMISAARNTDLSDPAKLGEAEGFLSERVKSGTMSPKTKALLLKQMQAASKNVKESAKQYNTFRGRTQEGDQ